jgi:hypothetical protein
MAKEKDTPNLPGSSRMQMPSTGSGSGIATNSTFGKGKGTSKRVLSNASGTGLKKSNPYC